MTISEQIVQTNARIAHLLANGQEGSTAIQAARQQLANLQAHQVSHAEAQAATAAVLESHAAKNPTTFAVPPRAVAE